MSSTSKNAAYSYNPFEPTGQLWLEVWTYSSGHLGKRWKEGERAKLEDQLSKSVAGMIRIAVFKRADRKAREEKERARQEKIDEVREVLRQIESEEKKVKTLEQDAASWRRAEDIRRYLEAVRESTGKMEAQDLLKVLEWIEWAERQANRIDPLKETPPSILDGKAEVLRRWEAVNRWW